MNLAHNHPESDEGSGIKRVPQVDALMKRRQEAFSDALVDFQSDAALSPLLSIGSSSRGGQDRGVLNFTLGSWHNFQQKYLNARRPDDFFNSAEQQQELTAIFAKSMNEIVRKWPQIAAQGHDWGNLCLAMERHLLAIAQCFGLRNEIAQAMADWFTTYREIQENERKYGERDRLAAEALQAHQQLAYLHTTGQKPDEEITGNVRMRIALIDQKLEGKPADPEKQPAFSRATRAHPQANPRTPEGKVPSAWLTEFTPDELEAKRLKKEAATPTGWRAAAKKIPLLGRFF